MKRLFRAGGALAAAAAIAAMGVTAAGAAQRASSPIKIGISLSLSGDFSDSGKAAMRGYQLWRDVVNKRGGIL
ncbi:MAG TPA: hypothetical protein VIU44_13610, partial [Gaiellaceae bacterium]